MPTLPYWAAVSDDDEMERNGYNLSYMSNIDLHMHQASLLQHKAYISLGHDEYWTKEMRDAVENARNNGVGLAFLEANAGECIDWYYVL